MKKWTALLFFLFFISGFNTRAQQLTDKTRISLITCGSGDELYSTFGHSALHIYDPLLGLDRVYNYGTFDFNTPNFYLKFTQGKLNYSLKVTSFDRFVISYQYEGRWVYRQDLMLNANQKNELYKFLEWNALPENKDYKYDFFYDNCSTRIRDAMEKVLQGKLSYPAAASDTAATFRQLIDLYLTRMPWSDVGIDLALGIPCDDKTDFRDKMFLPDYLMNGMGTARITDGSGTQKRLVGPEGFVLEPNLSGQGDEKSVDWIFWLIFFFAAASSVFGKAEKWRWFDLVVFSIVGLLGIAIALLWFATDHTATKWNMNLLWALPSWLYGAWLLGRRKPAGTFFKVHAIFLFFVVLSWPWIPQSLNTAMVPLVLALIARSWSWQKRKFVAQNK